MKEFPVHKGIRVDFVDFISRQFQQDLVDMVDVVGGFEIGVDDNTNDKLDGIFVN